MFHHNKKFYENIIFQGLLNLEFLAIDNNQLTDLHSDLFVELSGLQRLHIYDNLIERLDGQLFRNNTVLNTIYMFGNRINAIQSNFIDNVPRLGRLDLQGNLCTQQLFVAQGGVLQPPVAPALQTCFRNFGGGNVRRFNMRLEGMLELDEL